MALSKSLDVWLLTLVRFHYIEQRIRHLIKNLQKKGLRRISQKNLDKITDKVMSETLTPDRIKQLYISTAKSICRAEIDAVRSFKFKRNCYAVWSLQKATPPVCLSDHKRISGRGFEMECSRFRHCKGKSQPVLNVCLHGTEA